jgi:hypothetical protein
MNSPGHMDADEAAVWQERIAIWRRFRRSGQPRSVADPLLDDPDPFLP